MESGRITTKNGRTFFTVIFSHASVAQNGD